MFCGGLGHERGLVGVTGAHDHHVRHGPHEGEVLHALVGGPILAVGEPGIEPDDLDVQPGVDDGVAYLVVGPACREHAEGIHEGDLAAGGHAGRDTDHVALLDADVVVPAGEALYEGRGLAAGGQVRVEHHELGQLGAELRQFFAVCTVCVSQLVHVTFPPAH